MHRIVLRRDKRGPRQGKSAPDRLQLRHAAIHHRLVVVAATAVTAAAVAVALGHIGECCCRRCWLNSGACCGRPLVLLQRFRRIGQRCLHWLTITTIKRADTAAAAVRQPNGFPSRHNERKLKRLRSLHCVLLCLRSGCIQHDRVTPRLSDRNRGHGVRMHESRKLLVQLGGQQWAKNEVRSS